MGRFPSRRAALAALALAAGVLVGAGCGAKFPVPTETPGGLVPPDDSYTFKGSLDGVADLTDVLITRSSGNQLLVARGALRDERASCADGALVAGRLELYPIFPPPGSPPLSIGFNGLWRPQLVAENGGRLFVLDAGDSCACFAPDSLPRVVGFQIGDPDPRFAFGPESVPRPGGGSVCSWADIRGIAAANDRTVYLSGTFRVLELDEFNRPNLRFRDAIWRYKEIAPDVFKRDSLNATTAWEVPEGSGTGFVSRQRGIAWGPPGDPFLWAVDGDKGAVQKLAIETGPDQHGVYQFDGTTSGERFANPWDVDVDEAGSVYVADRGSGRVLRFEDQGASASFLQRVNLGILQGEPTLMAPAAVAVLDTIVYVADPPAAAARRYERRR